MQSAAASVHPTRRGPTAEAGWATATGRTKVSRAAVDAVAACGDAMPAKRTMKPTTAMAATAATFCVETTVPSTTKQHADHVEAHIGDDTVPERAGELDEEEQGERAEGGEQAHLWVREGDVRDGEGGRHHHCGPQRALDDEQVGVLRLEPAAEGGLGARSRYRRGGGLGHRPSPIFTEPRVLATRRPSAWPGGSGRRRCPASPTSPAAAWSARPPRPRGASPPCAARP